MKHVVIIGNGVAGITAARHIRKLSGFRITVISCETDHFFSRTALMYIYMGHMSYKDTKSFEDWFWKKNRINLVRAFVEKVDVINKCLILDNHKEISYDILLIATGSKPNKFGWPGQNADGVTGFYSCQDLERVEKFTRNIDRAVVVGGGLIGIELAEMMRSRHIEVTFLVREPGFWRNVLPEEESNLAGREIIRHRVDLKRNTGLKKIITNENNRAVAVETDSGDRIDCGFVGLAAGVLPNIAFLENSGIGKEKGVLVNDYLETNQADVYAIGDCAQMKNPPTDRRPIEAVWYTARMMGETVAQTICGNPLKYDPGVWFNSAKFFDIEYQTYGNVPSVIGKEFENLYWEHPEGRKCIRLLFDREEGGLRGVNSLGIRLRHDICAGWIEEHAKRKRVLEQLTDAWFDPEMFHNDLIEAREYFLNKEQAGSTA